MRLRTQLALAFLLLAVLPLTGVTVYSFVASQRAFRKAVEEEVGALTQAMSSQTEEVVQELGGRIKRMRERTGPVAVPSAYEKARLDALATAEQAEMGQLLRTIVSATQRQQGSIPFAIDSAKQVYTLDNLVLNPAESVGT